MLALRVVWAVVSMIVSIVAIAVWAQIRTFFFWCGNGLLKFVTDHAEDFE